MIVNWINEQIKHFKEVEALELKRKEQMLRHIELQNAQKIEDERNELIDLRRITINNVRYINSYMNTLKSNLNSAKGRNASETRKKRDWIRGKIGWLENKLTEEIGMISHYDSLLE